MQRYTMRTLGVLIVLVVMWGAYTTASAQQTVPMGPYFQTLQQDSSIAQSVDRGKMIFNELGCAGCHPRGGTIGGTALNVAGQRVPVPIPALAGAALHYPRLSMTGFTATIGVMNDLWNTVFLGREPMDPNSQQYMDLYAYVASLTPEVKAEMLRWEKERQAMMRRISKAGNPCNPCAAKNPCNPCAAKNPCNPCAAKNPCNPCAAKK